MSLDQWLEMLRPTVDSRVFPALEQYVRTLVEVYEVKVSNIDFVRDSGPLSGFDAEYIPVEYTLKVSGLQN